MISGRIRRAYVAVGSIIKVYSLGTGLLMGKLIDKEVCGHEQIITMTWDPTNSFQVSYTSLPVLPTF